jgi:hypothetical protein
VAHGAESGPEGAFSCAQARRVVKLSRLYRAGLHHGPAHILPFPRCDDAVSDATPNGISLVYRTMLMQVGAAVLAGCAFALAGTAEALAAFAGGGIAAIGTLILGRRMFATGVAPGAVLLTGSLLGTVLRWIWLVGAMWCALSLLRLPALPLIAGVAIGYAAAGLVTLRFR